MSEWEKWKAYYEANRGRYDHRDRRVYDRLVKKDEPLGFSHVIASLGDEGNLCTVIYQQSDKPEHRRTSHLTDRTYPWRKWETQPAGNDNQLP